METKPLLRDALTSSLREFVLERQEAEPVRIAPERDLAEMMGVSRISIRHALKALAAEGLLTRRQGSGTYIVPVEAPRAIQVLMASDIKQNDPFYTEFLSSMTHYCADHAIRLLVSREVLLAPLQFDRAPTVIVGLVGDSTIEAIRQTSSLVVSTQYYPDILEITQLYFDDQRIGSEAAEILYARGHRKVVHLAGPTAYRSAHERTQGFETAAHRRGMDVLTLRGKMNWRSGFELGDEVVASLGTAKAPTGVFASNDWMALGLMHRLAQDRVSVPGELSIIGCDDIHMAAEISPGLSTFRWDTDTLVRELVNIIADQDSHDPPIHKRVLLPARFVDRDTVAPAPEQAVADRRQ
jgi:DNA-binding LacI/PurR family transcriptional regulator